MTENCVIYKADKTKQNKTAEYELCSAVLFCFIGLTTYVQLSLNSFNKIPFALFSLLLLSVVRE